MTSRRLALCSTLASLVVTAFAVACRPHIPVPDVKVTADEEQLARGKYLVHHAMACVVCHSERDWSKLGGPVVAGSELGGSGNIARLEGYPDSFSFGAANLTPHFLQGWTDGEIARAVAFGQSRDGHGLFPLMPYTAYREHLSQEDLAALIAYLRTLPPAHHEIPERRFPMPGFVLDGMPEPRELRARTPQPGDVDHPAYVTAIAGCLACHTNADNRGRFIGPPYAGGREMAIPAPGAGKVRSANLTPDDETGLGRWTREQFIARFKAQTLEVARSITIEAGGANTPMPWWAYAGMSEEDLGAVYDFLRTLPPVRSRVDKLVR